MRDLFKEERAQISAELIIIIAAVLAIALVLIKNLQSTVAEGSTKMNNSSGEILTEIENIK